MTRGSLAELGALEGVPSALAAARDGIDLVLRDRGLRRTSPATTAESLLRGAHASAVLEGSTATLDEVRAGAGDPVAHDAVRLSTHLLGLAPLLRTAPLQALARMHAVAAASGPRTWPDGRPVRRLPPGCRRSDGCSRPRPRSRPCCWPRSCTAS